MTAGRAGGTRETVASRSRGLDDFRVASAPGSMHNEGSTFELTEVT